MKKIDKFMRQFKELSAPELEQAFKEMSNHFNDHVNEITNFDAAQVCANLDDCYSILCERSSD